MKKIEEVKEKRRRGWRLSEIIEDLLRNSEKLLKDWGDDPFTVLSQSGVRLQSGEEKEWLDMTTESWCHLSVKKQIKYATAYQKWYANEVEENVEKNFGKISVEMRLIPPGKFWMGSPENEVEREGDEVIHKVLISNAFWCGTHEVTQAQWKSVMGANPSQFLGDQLPVENVSWEDCQSFCEKTGMKLLTEAQWEYACRAGTTKKFSFGDDDNDLDTYAWYVNNSGEGTKNVKTREPNAWGIHDMHGNVWEWCSDWYGEYPREEVADPKGASSGSNRVFRGGGWEDVAMDCRSALRFWKSPAFRYELLGLRLSGS